MNQGMLKLTPTTYRFLASGGLILACLLGIIRLQQHQMKPQETAFTKADYLIQEEAEKLRLQLIKNIPSLGFRNIIADWLYLQYIQYFGDLEGREATGYVLSSDYMTAVVDKDPRFVDALIKLDAGTSIFGGDPQTSIKSYEKSLAVIPAKMKGNNIEPYYLWMGKGVNELLFMGDSQAAHRSYLMAGQWADQYNTPKAQQTAQRVRQTAQFLENHPSSKVAQIGAWTMVISSTSDERTIRRALTEIRALGGQITTDAQGNLSVKAPEGIE